MKKTLIIILITTNFIFLNYYNYANIDSLKNSLLTVSIYKKSEILNNLSFEFKNINLDSSFYYAELALKCSKKNKIKFEEGRALLRIANNHYATSNLLSGEKYYYNALSVFKELDNKNKIVKIYNNLGIINNMQGRYKKSIEYFQKSLSIKQKLNNDSISIANTLLNIGNVYFSWMNWDKATDFYFDALCLFEQTNNEYGIASTLNSMGNVYQKLEIYNKAIDYFSQALIIYNKLDAKREIATTISNIGNIYYFFYNDYNKALKNYKNANLIHTEINDYNGIVVTLYNIGHTYIKLKKYNMALEAFKKSLNLAEKHQLKNQIILNYESLSIIYELMDNDKISLDYYKKFHNLKDSIFNEEGRNKLAEYKTKYETEKKEIEIELLKKEKTIYTYKLKNQKILRNSVIIGYSLICLLIGLVFILLFSKRKIENVV
ncbi:MAG: tetratricopeptide repeat protein [Bacteroidales bacterium]|nr:tetratricopeptide repeat protein [Bacteroidales bacterium]